MFSKNGQVNRKVQAVYMQLSHGQALLRGYSLENSKIRKFNLETL
jgi:hypothetical protein